MIRFAQENDIEDIMKFIDEHWRKNHILARDKDFFLYQHHMLEEVSFVISRDEEQRLDGVLGYIPYGKEKSDIALALWKSVSKQGAFVGMQLLQYLMEKADARSILCPGINKKTTWNIYQYMGFQVGKMKHWYRVNPYKDYQIAEIHDKKNAPIQEETQYSLIEIKNFAEFEEKFNFEKYTENRPYKEKWYIKKRYFEHPIYKYQILGILIEEKIEMAVVFRVENCNDSKALRLIDVVGDFRLLMNITKSVDKLVQEIEAEYVDCYEAGLNEEILTIAGWSKVLESGNIIPNYFSPYVCENIDIYYSCTDSNVILFRGDGDQDRPS